MQYYKLIGNRVKGFVLPNSVSDTEYLSRRREVARKVLETLVQDPKTPTFEEYLDTVSFTPNEIKKLYTRIRRLEKLIQSGQMSRARSYGSYLAGSWLLTKAAAHSVLRDRTSPGYGRDLYRKPWWLSLDSIRRMKKVEIPRMRVWLNKPDGGLRPLAIPTLEDRIRERAIVTVAELLAVKMQSGNSIGFRYNQDRHRGLEEFLSKAVRKHGAMGFNIVDTDFRKYYDSIPHSGLRTLIRKIGISGPAWRYLCSTLTAPVQSSKLMQDKAAGKITGPMATAKYIPEKGTPQGGVISPLLANLYGAKLDKGLDTLNLVYLRYADNVLVAYPSTESKEWIIGILESIKPHGIELHPDKTQYLIGKGVLVTLGCGIIRENGRVRLMVSEGYDRREFKPGHETLVSRPFGGVPYLGGVLDFLRNLGLHNLHQRSPDRKGWAQKVRNWKTYLPKGNPLGLKGGVWRDIRILPEFKGIARIKGTPWNQIKIWEGKGKLVDILLESSRHRRRIEGLRERLEAVLRCKLVKLAGLHQLHEGFHISDRGYLFYGNFLRKVKAKYYKKSIRYALELAGHIILGNRGEVLRRGEVGILGRGIGRGAVFLKHKQEKVNKSWKYSNKYKRLFCLMR